MIDSLSLYIVKYNIFIQNIVLDNYKMQLFKLTEFAKTTIELPASNDNYSAMVELTSVEINQR